MADRSGRRPSREDDQVDSARNTKGKHIQPKQTPGRKSLRKIPVSVKYEGNLWDLPLGTDEYRMLYWLFWFISVLIDKARRIPI